MYKLKNIFKLWRYWICGKVQKPFADRLCMLRSPTKPTLTRTVALLSVRECRAQLYTFFVQFHLWCTSHVPARSSAVLGIICALHHFSFLGQSVLARCSAAFPSAFGGACTRSSRSIDEQWRRSVATLRVQRFQRYRQSFHSVIEYMDISLWPSCNFFQVLFNGWAVFLGNHHLCQVVTILVTSSKFESDIVKVCDPHCCQVEYETLFIGPESDHWECLSLTP